MAASELEFVRRAVLPSIRPPGADQTASMDLPEEGVASITGTGGGVIDLTFSVSHSWTRQQHKEEERTFDVVRVFNTDESGEKDESSFLDLEVMRQVKFSGGDKHEYSPPEIKDNMELKEEGLTRTTSSQ